MNTRTAHVAFEHLGIAHRVAQNGVVRLRRSLQFGDILDCIRQVELLVGNLVGHQFAEAIGLREQQLLHARHVLDRHLGGHRTVGDDVGDLLLAVLLRHPVEHATAAVVVEIDVDIGQRDTVGIQETLEQQVVGDRVDLRDPQAVGHGRTGRRTAARADRHVQLLACGADEVLHDEEVTRKTHRLHNVQLEIEPLLLFVGKLLAVTLARTVHRQLAQVIGLQLDAVELVVSAQFFDLLAGLLLAEHDVAVLVLRELVEEVFLRKTLPVALLGSELGRNFEGRHDGGVVDGIGLDLFADFDRRSHRFGYVAEDRRHLLAGFEPLLLGVEHSLGIVEVLAGREADQPVVRLGVVFVHKVHVVGTDQTDAVFRGQSAQMLVHFELHRIGFVVGPLDGGLVQLQFEVIVVAEEFFVPQDRLLGLLHVVGRNRAGHLARQAGRTADQPLVVFLQLDAVGTRTHVESFGPRFRHDLDEIVIPFEILGQQDQVVTALIGFSLLVLHPPPRHVNLAADDRLERCLAFQVGQFGPAAGDLRRIDRRLRAVDERRQTRLGFGCLRLVFSLDFLDVVIKFLDTEHVAVIGQRDARLSVPHGLVYQLLNAGLAVENRIL